MATNEDHKKAIGLQKALETLLALEKLGALPTDAADEVRNIVAEGIADKFSQPYRSFPCAREGTEIRRDAVPKQCTLRTSVQGFVANACSLDKTSKTKGQEGQKTTTNVAKPATAKERAAFNALAQVNKAQRNLSLTVGHSVRHERAGPRKASSPEKQQPKVFPKPSNPTKDGPSHGLQQDSLESGTKAWGILLAQKAAENKTPTPTNDQQKPATRVSDSPTTPANQRAGAKMRKDGQTVATATPKNGTSESKGGMTSQSLEATGETIGETAGRRSTPAKPGNPKLSRKASVESSEDLMDFGF